MNRKYKRPPTLSGPTIKVETGHGTLYVTINYHKGDWPHPVEIIARMGKAGGCNGAWLESTTRLASLALQRGTPLQDVIEELEGVTCCPLTGKNKSPSDALAQVLREYQYA
ncbi:hypothetical protein LCGC14_0918860 [marine sediment metagenome]|uniref:ribonucleoside-diphosphate reductase n=1 Tax=marine sediment metagenome TaxID=412755 RepID=A0A0F9NRJ9_9ZZZZ